MRMGVRKLNEVKNSLSFSFKGKRVWVFKAHDSIVLTPQFHQVFFHFNVDLNPKAGIAFFVSESIQILLDEKVCEKITSKSLTRCHRVNPIYCIFVRPSLRAETFFIKII